MTSGSFGWAPPGSGPEAPSSPAAGTRSAAPLPADTTPHGAHPGRGCGARGRVGFKGDRDGTAVGGDGHGAVPAPFGGVGRRRPDVALVGLCGRVGGPPVAAVPVGRGPGARAPRTAARLRGVAVVAP